MGKTKERWLDEAIGEYLKRLTGTVTIDFQWVKNDAALIDAVSQEKSVICLDPRGEEMTSQAFVLPLPNPVQEGPSPLALLRCQVLQGTSSAPL